MSYDPILGEITLFAGTYTPEYYRDCDGSLLQIAQNEALYSLIGTTYGGDGVTTFAVPDLRNRFPVHRGQGFGIPDRVLGSIAGTAAYEMSSAQLPATEDPGGDAAVAVFDTPPSVPLMPPYTRVRFVIAVVGIYPSHS